MQPTAYNNKITCIFNAEEQSAIAKSIMITKLEKQRIDTENNIRESIGIIESASLDRLVEIGISIDADYEMGRLSSVDHRLLDLKIMERMDALSDEA